MPVKEISGRQGFTITFTRNCRCGRIWPRSLSRPRLPCIWRAVVPGLLTNAIVPRWWDVSRNELHAVALYQRAGEELLAASIQDEELRNNVMSILNDRMSPQSSEHLEQALRAGNLTDVLPQLMPADTLYLASEYRRRFPHQSDSFGSAGKELESLSQHYPADVSWERLSPDFEG